MVAWAQAGARRAAMISWSPLVAVAMPTAPPNRKKVRRSIPATSLRVLIWRAHRVSLLRRSCECSLELKRLMPTPSPPPAAPTLRRGSRSRRRRPAEGLRSLERRGLSGTRALRGHPVFVGEGDCVAGRPSCSAFLALGWVAMRDGLSKRRLHPSRRLDQDLGESPRPRFGVVEHVTCRRDRWPVQPSRAASRARSRGHPQTSGRSATQ